MQSIACLQGHHLIFVCVVGVVEVLKGMQELEVSPDVETLTTYVLPVFPSMEAARQTLQVTHDTQHKSVCVCS